MFKTLQSIILRWKWNGVNLFSLQLDSILGVWLKSWTVTNSISLERLNSLSYKDCYLWNLFYGWRFPDDSEAWMYFIVETQKFSFHFALLTNLSMCVYEYLTMIRCIKKLLKISEIINFRYSQTKFFIIVCSIKLCEHASAPTNHIKYELMFQRSNFSWMSSKKVVSASRVLLFIFDQKVFLTVYTHRCRLTFSF